MTTTEFVLAAIATIASFLVIARLLFKYALAYASPRHPLWRFLLAGAFGLAAVAVTCLSIRSAGLYIEHDMLGEAAVSAFTGLLLASVLGVLSWLATAEERPAGKSELPPDSRVSDDQHGPWGDNGSSKP